MAQMIIHDCWFIQNFGFVFCLMSDVGYVFVSYCSKQFSNYFVDLPHFLCCLQSSFQSTIYMIYVFSVLKWEFSRGWGTMRSLTALFLSPKVTCLRWWWWSVVKESSQNVTEWRLFSIPPTAGHWVWQCLRHHCVFATWFLWASWTPTWCKYMMRELLTKHQVLSDWNILIYPELSWRWSFNATLVQHFNWLRVKYITHNITIQSYVICPCIFKFIHALSIKGHQIDHLTISILGLG